MQYFLRFPAVMNACSAGLLKHRRYVFACYAVVGVGLACHSKAPPKVVDVPGSSTPSVGDDQRNPTKASLRSVSNRRPSPFETTKKPAPNSQCGHAVALAGWRPEPHGSRDRLLICDPADNGIAGATFDHAERHAWKGNPREVPLHFGKHRPSIILLPSEPYTIVGAIIVRPIEDDPQSRSRGAGNKRDATLAIAANIPDFTQHFDPAWTGLCGAASAADILFSIASNRQHVLAEFDRKPSPQTDRDVAGLIAGHDGKLLPGSLASRMGMTDDGHGATNEGIRKGLESWLQEHDVDYWTATLDWMNDVETSRSQQREFFSGLGAAIRGGGGVVLCLWPGSEFADSAIGTTDAEDVQAESADRSHVEPMQNQVADAPLFPPLEGVPVSPAGGFPGRKSPTESPEVAIAQAEKQLNRARSALAAGDDVKAFEHLAEAVKSVRPHASNDSDCRAVLDRVIQLSSSIQTHSSSTSGDAETRRTLFK